MEAFKETLLNWLDANAIRYLGAILTVIIGLIAASWVGKLTAKALRKREKMDPMVRNMLVRLTKVCISVLVIVAALGQIGVSLAPLVAVIGAAGLAIGLALQGTLSNVAAGVMLLTLRPFNIGHAINVGGKVFIVDELGLFLTYAHEPDGPKATIPNSQLWNAQIINYSVTDQDLRRLNETVGISYSDDIGKAMEIIQRILDEDSRVLKEPAGHMGVMTLGESSVDICVRAWTKREDWWNLKLDFTRKVKEELDKAGVTIPFPQRDLHVYKHDIA